MNKEQNTVKAGGASVERAMLDVRDVAELLGCSTATVRRLADGGRMPMPVKLGWLVRWNRETIEEWIGQGCPRARDFRKGGA
jgi:excisionase family DNA binding protein